MNYINSDKRNRINIRCVKTITKSTTIMSKIHKKLDDAQTHKWAQPPQMKNKGSVTSFQPPKLLLVIYLSKLTCLIISFTCLIISFKYAHM